MDNNPLPPHQGFADSGNREADIQDINNNVHSLSSWNAQNFSEEESEEDKKRTADTESVKDMSDIRHAHARKKKNSMDKLMGKLQLANKKRHPIVFNILMKLATAKEKLKKSEDERKKMKDKINNLNEIIKSQKAVINAVHMGSVCNFTT